MSERIIFSNHEEFRFVLQINLKIVKLARIVYTGKESHIKDIEKVTEKLLTEIFTTEELAYIVKNKINSDVDGEIIDCLLSYSNELGPIISVIRNTAKVD